jgi:hypothetical protein
MRRTLLNAVIAVLVMPVSLSWALGPDATAVIAYTKATEVERCHEVRDYMELLFAGAFGNAARVQEIQKRTSGPRTPEREALANRYNTLMKDGKFSPEDQAAMSEVRERSRAFCPWGKEGVPNPIPPIPDVATARDAVRAWVPRSLMKLRQCEVSFPERRGVVEKTWAESAFTKLDMPELKTAVNEVRAWMKDGYALPPPPGSNMERELKDPAKRQMAAGSCDRAAGDLKRIEAALPAGILPKK